MQVLDTQKPIAVALTIAAFIGFLMMGIMTRRTLAQEKEKKTSSLVVRVAEFSNDQGRLDDYRDFINGHLFPTVRTVPGYVGTFLGRDANSGRMVSLSFWRSETDAVAGEKAVSQAIGALPQGSAPRPSKVDKYVVEFRDIKESLTR